MTKLYLYILSKLIIIMENLIERTKKINPKNDDYLHGRINKEEKTENKSKMIEV